MESCSSYPPWHDQLTHRTSLRPTTGKCLHDFFYFIDEPFGLGDVRVPTWASFRLQVGFNGHHGRARPWCQAGLLPLTCSSACAPTG